MLPPNYLLTNNVCVCIYIYIYMYVCVCVCVCVIMQREKEISGQKETICTSIDLPIQVFSCTNYIGLVSSVRQGPTRLGLNPRKCHTKDSKNGTCLTLNIIKYISKVKWSNPGKEVVPSTASRCSSYRKGNLLRPVEMK